MSLLIVRILVFWYQMQQLWFKWGASTLSCFTNFKRGTTRMHLSPKMFALYMNGLSNSYAGCYINDKCINPIMYADDICLMAPTGTAMQNLLGVCHNYGTANYILFNPLQYVCIAYKQKYYKLFCPLVNIGSEPMRFVNETNYLGFTFCNLNTYNKDILKPMRSVFAQFAYSRILRIGTIGFIHLPLF